MDDDQELIRALVDRAKALGLSDVEAGAKLGLTGQGFWKIKRGKTQKLGAETRRMAKAWLDVPGVVAPGFKEGAEKVIGEVEAMLSDLRRRLGLAEGTPVDPSLVGVGAGVAKYVPQNPVPGSQGQPKPQEKTKETG